LQTSRCVTYNFAFTIFVRFHYFVEFEHPVWRAVDSAG
jgi:hypothetical protein